MRFLKLTFPVMALLFLASCEPQVTTITEHSPDSEITVEITGKRFFESDPWEVTLNIKAYDRFNETISFQYYSKDFSTDNINLNWKADNQCEVSMLEQDGGKLHFRLNVNENRIHLRKIN